MCRLKKPWILFYQTLRNTCAAVHKMQFRKSQPSSWPARKFARENSGRFTTPLPTPSLFCGRGLWKSEKLKKKIEELQKVRTEAASCWTETRGISGRSTFTTHASKSRSATHSKFTCDKRGGRKKKGRGKRQKWKNWKSRRAGNVESAPRAVQLRESPPFNGTETNARAWYNVISAGWPCTGKLRA